MQDDEMDGEACDHGFQAKLAEIERLVGFVTPLMKPILDVQKSMGRVVPFLPGLIGSADLPGGKVDGIAVAFRENGAEVLLAARGNRPMAWIPVERFTVDPKAILTVEEARSGMDE